MKSVLFFDTDYSEEIATKTYCLPVRRIAGGPTGRQDVSTAQIEMQKKFN